MRENGQYANIVGEVVAGSKKAKIIEKPKILEI